MAMRAATGERNPIVCWPNFWRRSVVLSFQAEDAAHAGAIRAELESKGTPIGHYDYLIAAQARRRGAALVTANIREFARVPGLLLMDLTW